MSVQKCTNVRRLFYACEAGPKPFFLPDETGRRSDAKHQKLNPEGGAQPVRMNSHASTPGSLRSGTPTTDRRSTATTRGLEVVNLETRPSDTYHVGRRPRAKWITHNRVRTLVPAPKAYADARRPCVQPRTQFGKLNKDEAHSGRVGTSHTSTG